MRLLALLFCIMILPINTKLIAQVVGDDALQKLQDGEVSFLDGEFIVFLSDTVSPAFIQQTMDSLGYEISYTDIKSILISIVNSPADSLLTQLENHPEVTRAFEESSPVDSAYFKDILEQQGLTGLELDEAYTRLINSQTRKELYFEFEFSVNEVRLKEIMGEFRSVAYSIHQNYTRSVNIKCEPGSEQELMTEIERLPFVESTALIGVIGY